MTFSEWWQMTCRMLSERKYWRTWLQVTGDVWFGWAFNAVMQVVYKIVRKKK